MSETYCVIMAGGRGSRLWPVSRSAKPKQFLDLISVGRTMLQLTYDRMLSICDPSHIIVVTNDDYISFAIDQLPDLPRQNILCEPSRRNTGPCIAFATAYIKQLCPDAVMVVTPADHYITDDDVFTNSIKSALDHAAKSDDLVTIGITASRPETAFGYIQVGDPIYSKKQQLFHVKTFTEKPNEEMAKVFYDCGEFCWNSGVFCWNINTIQDAISKHMPSIKQQFEELDNIPISHWTADVINRIYENCEQISIDYGVMEKAQNVAVQLTRATWSDLGAWDAIYESGKKDNDDNVVMGDKAVLKNSEGCLVHVSPNKTFIIDGLKDFMILERGNVVLICPRNNSRNTWNYSADFAIKHNKK
ncbi:MAG: mannose-1-phosphate guanylyltransferase [Bacteroidales bacterium]|nr:mannose-1-phosphate guanylyltransferase [Bacteroidales bacterium]